MAPSLLSSLKTKLAFDQRFHEQVFSVPRLLKGWLLSIEVGLTPSAQ
jgi:hypothetical protein